MLLDVAKAKASLVKKNKIRDVASESAVLLFVYLSWP